MEKRGQVDFREEDREADFLPTTPAVHSSCGAQGDTSCSARCLPYLHPLMLCDRGRVQSWLALISP